MSEAILSSQLPTAADLSGLRLLAADSSGNILRVTLSVLSESLLPLIFAPQQFASDIDSLITPGLYLLNGLDVTGTLPDVSYPQYGHILVLLRASTIQQIHITRNAVCLRFRATVTDPWTNWTILT